MKLISIRNLTQEDLKNIPKNDSFDDSFDSQNTNQDLIDSNYIFATFKHKNRTYIVIHGYPGDNADGYIYDIITKKIVADIGEGCSNDNEFTDWYLEIGNNIHSLLSIDDDISTM